MGRHLWDFIWSDLKKVLGSLEHTDHSAAVGSIEDEAQLKGKSMKITTDYRIEAKTGIAPFKDRTDSNKEQRN